jgi:3-isopropylmalate/(R)-2-methylmalate dehydratase small subunit
MKSFTKHTGLVAPLDRANVDTDQIIPKQFLKRIERTGFGEFLFYDWRYRPDGQPNPDFVLNQPRYKGASILVAGKNFGCGSSREHAPWALGEFGFRAIIAPSFADIFANNCFKNSMLPITLSTEPIEEILMHAEQQEGYEMTVDLERQMVEDSSGLSIPFAVGEFQRYCLLEGLDDIGLTLRHEALIREYEVSHG